MIATIFGAFIAAMVVALPIAVGIGIATLLPSLLNPSFPGNLTYVIQSMVGGLNTTPILAIPLFMLSGAVMTRGGISRKLFDCFAVITGRRTAGMPCAVVITCLFYGAISGSGPATAAAVGAMTIPLLVELGYDKVFAAAIVATAGGLGVIIPPSIPFIMYGLTTGVSVGDMFIAGIVPGCLIAATLMLYAFIYCKVRGENKEKINANNQRLKERGYLNVFKDGFWALLTPVIILGGIYSGVVTPTEAACISVFYALIVCLFIYKTIKVRDIIDFLREAVSSYAALGVLIALAMAFQRVLIHAKAPAAFAALVESTISSKITLFLVLNLLLLIIGMFMDVGAAVVIVAPMLMPIAVSMGISPVHLGIVMVVNLAIGFVTPPFGLNLFVTAPLVDTPVIVLGKKALPFILTFVLALLLITFIPQISLCLL